MAKTATQCEPNALDEPDELDLLHLYKEIRRISKKGSYSQITHKITQKVHFIVNYGEKGVFACFVRIIRLLRCTLRRNTKLSASSASASFAPKILVVCTGMDTTISVKKSIGDAMP